jgi:hypothetical protein
MFTIEEKRFLDEALDMKIRGARIFAEPEQKRKSEEIYESVMRKLENGPQPVAVLYYDGNERHAYFIGGARLIELDPSEFSFAMDFQNAIEQLQQYLPNEGITELIEKLSNERARRLADDAHQRGFRWQWEDD